ncbi:MAG TPA: serine/threonine-protein kinase [Polyangiaceae bacterium]|nr:serine/threonine-protein kinase [Polyangiaceae bacterium]HNZ20787.1 serine/threonine-protein kinase [Polyangiaceae bacterium]HOE48216.1 serine/threonine-protein kinase [Polyangiaceae bacterium]HOG99317.1 serine/threonine-protein kinase [Polyangiaceae bacterium]HOR36900.1 serine/threonine-protein kinase [Polyangiaceae bacterium]
MSGSRSSPSLPVTIGRYELRAELAHGGMATVFLGRLEGVAGFSRAVAIKRLHPQFVKDPSFVAMFADEARLTACIHSPNVVSINDVVMYQGELLLVMDFVHGASLSVLFEVMRQRKQTIDMGIVARIIYDTLNGLHAAHEAQDSSGKPLSIVHRDVSPQNILVDVAGVARVIDFGVAKAASRFQNTLEGQLKGKLHFMAPEQIRNQRVDRRADVFAAAVVLWTTLAGRRPFESENEANIVFSILEGRRPDLHTFAPSVPPALKAVIDKGLSLDPNERYCTAANMAEALESAIKLASQREVARWVHETVPSDIEHQAALRFDVESSVNSGHLSSVHHTADVMDEEPPRSAAPSNADLESIHADRLSWSNPSRISSISIAKEPSFATGRPTHQHSIRTAAAIVGPVVMLVIVAGWWLTARSSPPAEASIAAFSTISSTRLSLAMASTSVVSPSPEPMETIAPAVSSSATLPLGSTSTNARPRVKPARTVPAPSTKKKRKDYGF